VRQIKYSLLILTMLLMPGCMGEQAENWTDNTEHPPVPESSLLAKTEDEENSGWDKKMPELSALPSEIALMEGKGAYTDWTGCPNGEAIDFEWVDPVVKFIVYSVYLNMEASTEIFEQVDNSALSSLDPAISHPAFAEYMEIMESYIQKHDIRLPQAFLNEITDIIFVENGDNKIVSVDLKAGDPCRTHFAYSIPIGVQLTSLEDFAHMPNLETLWLFNVNFAELTPLLELPLLQRIGLDCTNIRDLSVLGEMPAVTELTISYLDGQDLSFLKDMTNLKSVSSFFNKSFDLQKFVACLPAGVTELSLSSNEIQDITPLSKLTQLEKLSLDYNQIRDVTPLTKLTNLKYLYLAHNQIENAAPLMKMKYLEELRTEGNPITNYGGELTIK